MEWSDGSKYNSFNSWKGLAFYPQYQNIAAWMQGQAKLGPPIECNLDPIAECNLACPWCITQRYLRTNRQEVGEMRQLPLDYMLRLVDFLAAWGVKGLCISGGGEPSLHKEIWKVIPYAADAGLEVAFVTNATVLSPQLIESLMRCRWVALSVDAAWDSTYRELKKGNNFPEVLRNIQALSARRRQTDSKVDLCFKFLMWPGNIAEMHDACLLAKSLGVQDFHVRPVDFERQDIQGNQKLQFDRSRVREAFARCHEEETAEFRVFTVTHKFDENFHVHHDFRCLASPLILPVLSNGNAYLCVEQKMKHRFYLGPCYPDPESIKTWWGGLNHLRIVHNIVPDRDCSRCVYGEYNKQIEEAVIQDRMCVSFP